MLCVHEGGEQGGGATEGALESKGPLCQVSREMAGTPGTCPCPLLAESYTWARYSCPHTAAQGLPAPDPSAGERGPLPKSLGAGKHPLSESQILVPRKEEGHSLKRGRSHFNKEVELYRPKETR